MQRRMKNEQRRMKNERHTVLRSPLFVFGGVICAPSGWCSRAGGAGWTGPRCREAVGGAGGCERRDGICSAARPRRGGRRRFEGRQDPARDRGGRGAIR